MLLRRNASRLLNRLRASLGDGYGVHCLAASHPASLDELYAVCVHCTQMPAASTSISIRFDQNSGIPAVRQIVDSLRVLLVERKLVPVDTLPSVRRLAMELGVHFNTVAEAYRELANEGWLELRHGRKATVVARPACVSVPKNWPDEFRNRLRGLVAEVRAAGVPAGKLAAELNAMAKAVKTS